MSSQSSELELQWLALRRMHEEEQAAFQSRVKKSHAELNRRAEVELQKLASEQKQREQEFWHSKESHNTHNPQHDAASTTASAQHATRATLQVTQSHKKPDEPPKIDEIQAFSKAKARNETPAVMSNAKRAKRAKPASKPTSTPTKPTSEVKKSATFPAFIDLCSDDEADTTDPCAKDVSVTTGTRLTKPAQTAMRQNDDDVFAASGSDLLTIPTAALSLSGTGSKQGDGLLAGKQRKKKANRLRPKEALSCLAPNSSGIGCDAGVLSLRRPDSVSDVESGAYCPARSSNSGHGQLYGVNGAPTLGSVPHTVLPSVLGQFYQRADASHHVKERSSIQPAPLKTVSERQPDRSGSLSQTNQNKIGLSPFPTPSSSVRSLVSKPASLLASVKKPVLPASAASPLKRKKIIELSSDEEGEDGEKDELTRAKISSKSQNKPVTKKARLLPPPRSAATGATRFNPAKQGGKSGSDLKILVSKERSQAAQTRPKHNRRSAPDPAPKPPTPKIPSTPNLPPPSATKPAVILPTDRHPKLQSKQRTQQHRAHLPSASTTTTAPTSTVPREPYHARPRTPTHDSDRAHVQSLRKGHAPGGKKDRARKTAAWNAWTRSRASGDRHVVRQQEEGKYGIARMKDGELDGTARLG